MKKQTNKLLSEELKKTGKLVKVTCGRVVPTPSNSLKTKSVIKSKEKK